LLYLFVHYVKEFIFRLIGNVHQSKAGKRRLTLYSRFITSLTVNEDFIHFIFGRIDLEYTMLFGGLETKMQ